MNIEWDENKCCHSGICVRSLPGVFKIENGRFVIAYAESTRNETVKVINQCPSAALKIIEEI